MVSLRLAAGIVAFASTLIAQVSEAEIRAAIAKPLALMQTTSLQWLEKNSCTSCHHQTLPMIAFDLARRHGVALDHDTLQRTVLSSLDVFADLDTAVQGTLIGESVNIIYRMVAEEPLGMPRTTATAAYARLIARRQLADGHWEHDDHRPPQASSSFSMTAYSLQTLQLFLPEQMALERIARVRRARVWLEKTSPRDTEDHVYQMRGLSWAGDSPARLSTKRDGLLAMQHPDGGWSQLPGRASDAYATGESLAALHQTAGLPITSAAYQKGLRFLLNSQKVDGTWFVTSRIHPPAPVSPPYVETGWPYGHDQFVSAMGTSWAVSALILALPELAATPAPLQLDSLKPRNVPGWAATVLFGGRSDLQKLLDSGWDANSATAKGTTALMMAAPDFGKADLLVARGADVNARARKTRYTALMIAGSHHATDSVRLLLSHGAEAQPPKDERATAGATALFLAAVSGDVEAVEALKTKGGDVHGKVLLFGMDLESPLSIAVGRGEPSMIEALIRDGVKVDVPDPDNRITLLSLAVFRNDADTARLLIHQGADVNHQDKFGFTPLHWAANVDFGDTAFLELLLKAGANPATRNHDGVTPLQLAMKYGHSRHQVVLQRVAIRQARR